LSNEVLMVNNVTKTFKLKTKGATKNIKNVLSRISRNRLIALEDVTFQVSKGEMLGIIGLNGGGKTTLLRTIAGLYQPDSGSITVRGRLAPLLHIGTGFQLEFNAKENIVISGMLLGISKSEISNKVKKILEFAELQEFSNMKLKNYSTGMKARLAFSTSLEVNPDILLVDEILAVGDISFREKSFNAFLSFKKNGKTILYTTHNLGMLTKLCDRVLLLHQGKNIMIGEPFTVLKKYKEISGQKDFQKNEV